VAKPLPFDRAPVAIGVQVQDTLVRLRHNRGSAAIRACAEATRIDRASRNQQDGQTVGLPIGPDCSLIVAEVILAAVDLALGPRQLRGLRHIDDYEIGFGTPAEA
jgi:hypothetical protein